jgi:hypothetical protein
LSEASIEAWERVETLHEQLMAAYAVAEGSLVRCQSTGVQADVDQHRADLRRALRLSNSYHLEADQSVLTWQAQWWSS